MTRRKCDPVDPTRFQRWYTHTLLRKFSNPGARLQPTGVGARLVKKNCDTLIEPSDVHRAVKVLYNIRNTMQLKKWFLNNISKFFYFI